MTIKEIIQKLNTTMTDAGGHESHFESWLILNEGIVDAIDALKALDNQEPEWYHGIDVYGCNRFYHKTEDRTSDFNTPLYTTPT